VKRSFGQSQIHQSIFGLFLVSACDGKEQSSPLAQANVSETRDHLTQPSRQPGHNGPFLDGLLKRWTQSNKINMPQKFLQPGGFCPAVPSSGHA